MKYNFKSSLFFYLAFCCYTLLLAGNVYAEKQVLRLASTTSTKASGLLDIVIPAFEKKTGIKVNVSATGSGKAMQLGRIGKADVLWAHSPEAEKIFINQGYGLKRHYTMHNDFLIVCPKTDPAGISDAPNIEEAMHHIANKKSLFISRGDDSGTHNKELQLWRAAQIEPYGRWYYEIGQGMKKTLSASNDKQAYTLVDKATWLFNGKNTTLHVCFQGDPALLTEYNLIAVNPAKHKNINHSSAKAFIKYVTSDVGRALILSQKIDGKTLFKLSKSKK